MMPIEKQVVSLELSKRLKELGCKQESLFYWDKADKCRRPIQGNFCLVNYWPEGSKDKDWWYSAFTCSELGEIMKLFVLPEYTKMDCWHDAQRNTNTYASADTEVDARAKMLIYLLENGLMGKEGG